MSARNFIGYYDDDFTNVDGCQEVGLLAYQEVERLFVEEVPNGFGITASVYGENYNVSPRAFDTWDEAREAMSNLLVDAATKNMSQQREIIAKGIFQAIVHMVETFQESGATAAQILGFRDFDDDEGDE